jgi:aubergine-like protein
VDFDQNALSTFHLRKEDRHISYVTYYREKYQLTINVPTQPLLLSKATRRDVNRGDTEPRFLIPELCGMTGLSDEQR